MNKKQIIKKQATAQDVAKLSGTSKAAVSRAFSTEKRSISEDLRKKVFAAAKQLGYKPNPLASSLTTKRTHLVAILVNHIHDFSDLDLFDALIAALQKQGKQSLIIRLNDMEKIKEFMSLTLAYHVDAVLVFSDMLSAKQAHDIFATSNIVMLNGIVEKNIKSLSLNVEKGISEAIEYLKRENIHHMALITGRESSPSEQKRIETYKKNILKNNIKISFHAHGDYSYEAGYNLSRQYFKTALPEAILCSSDAMAMGVIDYIKEKKIPFDVTKKVIGFDNISLARMLKPYQFPTIAFDRELYIQSLVDMVMQKQNPQSPENDNIQIPTFFQL